MDKKTLDRLEKELEASERERNVLERLKSLIPKKEEKLIPGDYFMVAEDPWGIQVKEVFDDVSDANKFIKLVVRANPESELMPTIWVRNVDEDGVEGKMYPVINL